MANKTLYATCGLKYGTRRLQAGDQVEMDAPSARLYLALGKVTEAAPAKRRLPQLDHDGDGEAGGSPAGEQSTRRRGRRKSAE